MYITPVNAKRHRERMETQEVQKEARCSNYISTGNVKTLVIKITFFIYNSQIVKKKKGKNKQTKQKTYKSLLQTLAGLNTSQKSQSDATDRTL